MLTENTTTDDLLSSGENIEDESLDWLLDEDYEEPKDTLFTLAQESFDTSLSETELEMAARPMARGDSEFDSLSSYVEEEIVIGSVGDSSDIYSKTVEPEESFAGHNTGFQSVPMPIARAKPGINTAKITSSISLDEGADLLGLIEHDDMGEKPLVIQRISKAERLAPPAELADQAEVASETPVVVFEEMVVQVSADVVDKEPQDQPDAPSICLELEAPIRQIESSSDTELPVEAVTSAAQSQSLDEPADSLILAPVSASGDKETLDSPTDFFELEFEGNDVSLDAMASALGSEQNLQHAQNDSIPSTQEMEEIFDLDFSEEPVSESVQETTQLLDNSEGLAFTEGDHSPHEHDTPITEAPMRLEDVDGMDDVHGQPYDRPDILSEQPLVDDSDIVDFPIADSANDQDFDTAIDFSEIAVAMKTIPVGPADETLAESAFVATEQDIVEDIFGGDLDEIAIT